MTRWGSIHRCSLYIQNNNNLHRQQTIRLSLLNTISLTFIIFSACLLRLQSNTLYSNIKLSIPSDLLISSDNLDVPKFASFLEDPQNSKFIQGFEFVRAPVTSAHLSSYSGYSVVTPIIYTLSSNYLQMMCFFLEFLNDRDEDMTQYTGSAPLREFLENSNPSKRNSVYPVIDIRSIQQPSLHIQENYEERFPALFPASIASTILASENPTYVSYLQSESTQHETVGYLQKLPGFQFSKYNLIQSASTLILSEATFNSLFPDEKDIKKQLVIKLKESLSDRDYAYIVDSTRSL